MAGSRRDNSTDTVELWPRSFAAGLALRGASDGDMVFLESLYASTRREELAPVPWSDAEKRKFLAQQFAAQHDHYLKHYPDAERLVVEREGQPIGRLYIDRWTDEHRIVDIALLPEARGRGWGTALMGDLIEEAEAAGKPVSIHVEHMNPALSFYRRLGFESVEEKGVYRLLERRPGVGGDPSA